MRYDVGISDCGRLAEPEAHVASKDEAIKIATEWKKKYKNTKDRPYRYMVYVYDYENGYYCSVRV